MDKTEWTNEWIQERYDLSKGRIGEIAAGNAAPEPYDEFFGKTAAFMLYVENIYEMRRDGSFERLSPDELEDMNYELYRDILPGVVESEEDEAFGWNLAAYAYEGSFDAFYDGSYANPTYACKCFGSIFGPLLGWLSTEVRALIPLSFQERLEEIAAINELFIGIYNRFENAVPADEEIRRMIYWYVSDYSDQTLTRRIREQMDPSLNYYRDIIMNADLSDLSYLYQYGDYISGNEKQIAAYLNSLDDSVIEGMAATFVQGYVRGFEVYKIDLSAKKNVQLRAHIGFERVIRAAIRQFEALGLSVIVYGEAAHSINRGAVKNGLVSSSPNPQYDYDHRMDKGLYLDKALAERISEVTKVSYEKYKDLAAVYAGPAVMEVFGEAPFEPMAKEESVRLSKKQEKISVALTGKLSQITNEYIDAASTSFTIIAWPMPSIGDDFRAIMDATIEVNNLDNDLFRSLQQKMIDAMDGAKYVHITGMNGNETDLKVSLWQLKDPAKETVFENCCADVNIPVGEVFTSPVLMGTEGVLHVSGVYLNELNYRNLRLEFKDGCIASYSCTNYSDEKKNTEYIKENLLQNRETLPMGEFAIGTNTTAYAMARKYDIGARMPILIMEKTGPHFAVGDTCYSHSEDHRVYNPDGKEIVARENEKSRLRHTDPAQAYFNVHTDITIPYDEIGAITAHFEDGRKVDIIRDGLFCLEGTEVLNEALLKGADENA